MRKLLQQSFGGIAIVILFTIAIVLFSLSKQYVVPIMTYHNISSDVAQNLNSVSVKSFERQMKFLKNNGYHVLSFDKYFQIIQAKQSFPHNSVMIQFDDGYVDNHINAFPILKNYNFPATVFIVSDFIGNNPEYLTWEQVSEMNASVFTIGSHTRHHAYLPSIPHDLAVDEIIGSKKVIEEKLAQRIDYFAYPSGGFSDDVKHIVKDAGYQAAVTTNRGRSRLNRDMFELNRIRIKNSDGEFALKAKLSGYYNLFRSKKNPH